jgi:predicted ester cyclase
VPAVPAMPAEANKALIRRLFEEGFHSGKLVVVDEIFHPNFVDRSTPEQPPGTEGVKDYISMVRTGFPNISITIEDLVAEEERVVVRTTWRGTHLGEYEGIAPTGKQVTRSMIQIFHVRDGKLLEEWSEGESLSQQIL